MARIRELALAIRLLRAQFFFAFWIAACAYQRAFLKLEREATAMKTYLCGLRWFCLLLAIPLAASATKIYVLNNGGSTVDVIDPATNKIVQTIQGIPRPHGITFSPDAKRAYVTSETEQGLFVIDTKTAQITNKVPLDKGAANLPAITRDGKLLFICINGLRDDQGNMLSDRGGAIDVVDLVALQKVKTLTYRGGMHDCYITPDGKYVVGGSNGGKLLAVVDANTGEPLWEMHFDKGVLNIAIEANPDGSTRRLLVPLNETRSFAVIDFATHKEIERITVPNEHSGYLQIEKLKRRDITPVHGTAISPDGKEFWLGSRGSNGVFVYSLPDLKVLDFVPTPKLPGAKHPHDSGDPGWVSFSPDGKLAYVANAAANSISAINVKTRKIVANIPVGEQPDHVETALVP